MSATGTSTTVQLAVIALLAWKPAETSDVRALMALVRTLLCDAHHSAAD